MNYYTFLNIPHGSSFKVIKKACLDKIAFFQTSTDMDDLSIQKNIYIVKRAFSFFKHWKVIDEKNSRLDFLLRSFKETTISSNKAHKRLKKISSEKNKIKNDLIPSLQKNLSSCKSLNSKLDVSVDKISSINERSIVLMHTIAELLSDSPFKNFVNPPINNLDSIIEKHNDQIQIKNALYFKLQKKYNFFKNFLFLIVTVFIIILLAFSFFSF